MKRLVPAIFIFLLFFSVARAQDDFATKFGQASRSELDLKPNPAYPDAPAVVLDDLGKVQFFGDEKGVTIIYNRRTKIKIFTDAGKAYAKVAIPYQINDAVSELVYNVEAITLTHENGQIVRTKLKAKDIHTIKLSATRYVTEFELPEVKKGSVIEYRYMWKTNSPYDLPSWNFQWTIPVVYSAYTVRMMPFYKYTWQLQGDKKPDYYSSGVDHFLKHTYEGTVYYDDVLNLAMNDVPAFRDKDFVPTVNNYLMRVNFQLSKIIYPSGGSENMASTWSQLITQLLKKEDLGKYLKKSLKPAARLMNMAALKKQDEAARFEAVMNFLKNHFHWNHDLDYVPSQKPGKLISEKTGNAADINLMAVSLLRSAGIDAHPVLISTRRHGLVRSTDPYLPSFNDVIVVARVDGRQVLTDATAPLCLNDCLPIRCINGKGLVLKAGKPDWVLLDRTPSSQTMTKNVAVISANRLQVHVSKEASGYDALALRKQELDQAGVLAKILNRWNYTPETSTLVVQHQRKDPYRLRYDFKAPVAGTDTISLSPFFHEIDTANPFTEKTRTYPIDLIYPDHKMFVTTITVPSGYTIRTLPRPLDISNDLFELKYTAVQTGNQVVISLEYAFKWPVYPAFDYQRLKSFFAAVVEKGNGKILLVKH